MKSFKKELIEFSASTTCHGVSQLGKIDKPWYYRIIWGIIVVGLAGCMIWQLHGSVSEYTEWRTNTDLSEMFVSKLDFPSVTICNFNRFFNFTSHKELAAVDALLRASSPGRNRAYDDWWKHEVDEFLLSRNISEFYLTDEFHDKGWQLDDKTIQTCTFKQETCTAANFTKIVTSMGNCFTFTPRENSYQTAPGSSFGLLVTLNIMQTLYSEHPMYGNVEAGIKVLIHESGELPLVEEYGIAVSSGTTAHIVVEKVEKQLMYQPWGVCSRETPELQFFKPYTFRECMRECRLVHILNKCGCLPYWSPKQEDYQECNSKDILNCAGQAEEECKCVQSCHSTSFNSKVSYATYPSLEVGEIMAQNLFMNETSGVAILGSDLNIEESDPFLLKLQKYRDNHLQIDVYYDSLSFMKIVQSKKVSENSLFSNIGGILGLWLGISIVTVAEIIQLFFKSTFAFKNDRNNRVKVINKDVESNGDTNKHSFPPNYLSIPIER